MTHKYRKMKKKGLSPVIATVLLIMIVVVLALIIFLWARGFVSEKVAKFGEPVGRACDRVRFEAGAFSSGQGFEIDINNQGEVPLYGFDIKKLGKGEIIVTEYTDQTVGSGQSLTLDQELSSDYANSEIIVVPIILGETDKGRVAYTCGDQYGVGITL
jgi:flagellin-like protein